MKTGNNLQFGVWVLLLEPHSFKLFSSNISHPQQRYSISKSSCTAQTSVS